MATRLEEHFKLRIQYNHNNSSSIPIKKLAFLPTAITTQSVYLPTTVTLASQSDILLSTPSISHTNNLAQLTISNTTNSHMLSHNVQTVFVIICLICQTGNVLSTLTCVNKHTYTMTLGIFLFHTTTLFLMLLLSVFTYCVSIKKYVTSNATLQANPIKENGFILGSSSLLRPGTKRHKLKF